jgi:hypothetical protein
MAHCDLKPKSLRQRARRLEQAALAKVTGSQDVLQFETDLLALLNTKTGQRLLSEICAKMRVSRDSQQVIQNFKSIVDLMNPRRRTGRGSARTAPMLPLWSVPSVLGPRTPSSRTSWKSPARRLGDGDATPKRWANFLVSLLRSTPKASRATKCSFSVRLTW